MRGRCREPHQEGTCAADAVSRVCKCQPSSAHCSRKPYRAYIRIPFLSVVFCRALPLTVAFVCRAGPWHPEQHL